MASATARAQGWFAMLRTLVQFEKWDAILQGEMLPVFGRARQDAWRHWAFALAYANTGKLAAARDEAAKFDASLADYRTRTKRSNPAELDVARAEMQAHLELAAGHTAAALKQFATASAAERRLIYTEPPYYPRPVGEPWGRAALKAGKAKLSQRAFAIALEQYPNDSHARPTPAGSTGTAAAPAAQ